MAKYILTVEFTTDSTFSEADFDVSCSENYCKAKLLKIRRKEALQEFTPVLMFRTKVEDVVYQLSWADELEENGIQINGYEVKKIDTQINFELEDCNPNLLSSIRNDPNDDEW